MPSKILKATKAPNGYHFLIWLDTDRVKVEVDEDGGEIINQEPDPAWLYDLHFGPLQPSLLPLHKNGGHNEKGEFLHACTTQHGKDLTEEDYLKNIMEQIPHQVELELHRRNGTSHHDRDQQVLEQLQGREIH